MKTIGEFKKAGLVFVEGDERSSIHKGHGNAQMTNEMAFGTNKDDKTDRETVISFVWRENAGVKPEFVGQIEWVGYSDFVYVNHSGELIWSGKCIAKWRPRLNQPQKWPDNSRIDSIGQNGNDGLHYDNTAQQVEEMAANHTLLQPRNPEPIFRTNEDAQKTLNEHLAKLAESKPVFTQAMADAGELPPVGSIVKVCLADAGFHVDGYDEQFELKICLVAASFINKYGSKMVVISNDFGSYGCYVAKSVKPIDTRTDREKAIDEMFEDAKVQGSKGAFERLYDAGYRKC